MRLPGAIAKNKYDVTTEKNEAQEDAERTYEGRR